jgi:class 3 adenylate cyclase/tetratricopeptide (TPR) repeat protein
MAEPRRERKVVTVLFADLVGFTSRAEQLDPEDVDAVLRPYHERLRGELEQWGGTVEKFIGDAVVAVFGAPIAREDDPERALRAALAIRDWAIEEDGVEVRIAVNTGEALVSLDARPDSGEGLVAGDVVNTASRLQSAAPVNGILVGEQTQRATGHVIDYREAELVLAKGKSEPIPVWEALQARSRFGVDVRQHGGAELVGRDGELNTLVQALARAQREREPQLVTLVGVPGIGKSRLVWELFGEVGRGDTLVYWRQGRSLPYGEGVSFWALAEMVKAQAGIHEDDDRENANAKLVAAVRAVVDEDAEWVASRLGPLVGIADAAPSSRAESFTAWRAFFEGLAEQRPIVLVFEDIHWADAGLLDFVDHLADWVSGVPMLLVCTARPELHERRPDWGGGKRNALTLNLSPLSEEESARLLSLILDRSVLPADVQRSLLERASGNPLYAEQFGRLYLERGSIDDLELPENVHGLIAARLDALPAEEKALLQDAAVMGKVFWSGALAGDGAPTERLHALERKEFIRRERRSSVAGESEFGFRHALVRDVAYGQIPRAERAAKHARAADWIESLGRQQDHAELLAHHCVAALELVVASGGEPDALRERARRAQSDAGDRAMSLNAFGNAAGLYRSALDLEPGDDDRARLLFRMGRALHYSEGGGEEALEDAAARLEALGDVEAAADAENLLAQIGVLGGRRTKAESHLARAVSLAEHLPVSPAKASVAVTRARSAYLEGDYGRALVLAEEARAMADALGLDALRAEALLYLGGSKIELGDTTGLEDVRETIDVFTAINSPEAARAYNNFSVMLRLAGEVKRAHEVSYEGVAIAERFGLEPYIRWDRAAEWDEALRLADAYLAELERTGGYPGGARLVRAIMRVGRDDDAGAVADIEAALEIARAEGYPQTVFPTLNVGAFVFLSVGQPERTESLLDEVAERKGKRQERIPYGGGPLPVWTWAHFGRAEEFLAGFAGDRPTPWLAAAQAGAAGDWQRAADIYAGMEVPIEEAFALLYAGGEAGLRRALEVFRRARATRYLRQAEAGLAAIA